MEFEKIYPEKSWDFFSDFWHLTWPTIPIWPRSTYTPNIKGIGQTVHSGSGMRALTDATKLIISLLR